MPTRADLRKHPRASIDLVAQAKPVRRGMFEAKVLNLSEGGTFLSTSEKLVTGSDLLLTLVLEVSGKKKSCMVQGKVAWANTERARGAIGCGIIFSGVSPLMTQFIRDYVASKLKGSVTATVTPEPAKEKAKSTRGQLRG